jgi:hypothetical protein
VSFILIFFGYLGLRLHSLLRPEHDPKGSELAFDLLACGAAVLFPRLAFTVIQGNILMIALVCSFTSGFEPLIIELFADRLSIGCVQKRMLLDFAAFMTFALACFSGIYYALLMLAPTTNTVRLPSRSLSSSSHEA